jgi:predicted DNA-binding ArsR family transcriptional regulator
MKVLQTNPTAADLDFLVSAYAVVGNLAADAQHDAEVTEMQRKIAEATAYREAKASGDKVTDTLAINIALANTVAERQVEIDARTRAKKIAALLDAIREAINAIKYLGRYDSATVKLPGQGG